MHAYRQTYVFHFIPPLHFRRVTNNILITELLIFKLHEMNTISLTSLLNKALCFSGWMKEMEYHRLKAAFNAAPCFMVQKKKKETQLPVKTHQVCIYCSTDLFSPTCNVSLSWGSFHLNLPDRPESTPIGGKQWNWRLVLVDEKQW